MTNIQLHKKRSKARVLPPSSVGPLRISVQTASGKASVANCPEADTISYVSWKMPAYSARSDTSNTSDEIRGRIVDASCGACRAQRSPGAAHRHKNAAPIQTRDADSR